MANDAPLSGRKAKEQLSPGTGFAVPWMSSTAFACAVSCSGRMRMRFGVPKRVGLALVALVLAIPLGAQEAKAIAGGNPALPLIRVENGQNSAAAQKAHYVVLVSLDGF